jgi:hypothetical protein
LPQEAIDECDTRRVNRGKAQQLNPGNEGDVQVLVMNKPGQGIIPFSA